MKNKIFNKTAKLASASMLVASCLLAGSALAKDTVKVGVVSFLTGPAAGVCFECHTASRAIQSLGNRIVEPSRGRAVAGRVRRRRRAIAEC